MIKPFCDLIFISFTELVQYIFDERLLDFCYVVYWWLHLLSLSESRLSLLLSPGEGNSEHQQGKRFWKFHTTFIFFHSKFLWLVRFFWRKFIIQQLTWKSIILDSVV